MLDRIKGDRGLRKLIRSDNGREFCGGAMTTGAHENGVNPRFIESGKPNRNVCVERAFAHPEMRPIREHLTQAPEATGTPRRGRKRRPPGPFAKIGDTVSGEIAGRNVGIFYTFPEDKDH
jgi:hypothetical protein